jgi:serine/threonine protein kinase
MHQMVRVVQNLHDKHIVHGDMKLDNMPLDTQGNVRLCDFAEGRSTSEPEGVWEGMTTWHYESPNRRRRGEQLGRDTPPPIIEDDLFGLGLSIWQLFTGRVPHGDMVQDDMGLREKQLRGETVDVTEVDDREARDIITGLLRQGGAHI